MKDSGIKIVSLSLDGSTKEVHDDFRGQEGAFDGVMKAAELFRKHDIKFIINSSFTKRNQHDIKNVYQLAKKSGLQPGICFSLCLQAGGKIL